MILDNVVPVQDEKNYHMGAATLFLMCGLPGSGKTTLAKKLEKERHAVRLTPDEWMGRLFGDGLDEAKRAVVEDLLWSIAARCLTLGINVILDFGFWSRAERDDYRARAHSLGARTELYFLDVSTDELIRRLKVRDATSPEDTFQVSEEQLKLWAGWFEPPTEDELKRT